MLESRASLNIVGGDRSAPTIIVNAVFLGIAWFAVLLRVYTRVWLVKMFYLEDWFMVFATMIFTVYCAGVIRQSEIVNVGHNVPLPLQSIVDATMVSPERIYMGVLANTNPAPARVSGLSFS
jgi:hypothetical protein